jgi:hypothetical protein
MNRFTIPACLLLFLIGCERSPVAPEPPQGFRVGQRVIISGFSGEINAYLDNQGYRVGRYFDFSPYDSLTIAVTAQRYVSGTDPVPFSVRVGPDYYIKGMLAGQKQDFVFFVHVWDLAKPRSSAFVFLMPDSVQPLVLTDLRVIGWYSYSSP